MKKIYTLLAIAATLLLASCDKFLNREPITNITPEKYFKSADELAAYTINYYTTFFTSYAGNYSVGVIWEDAFTDNLVRDGSGNGTALRKHRYGPAGWFPPDRPPLPCSATSACATTSSSRCFPRWKTAPSRARMWSIMWVKCM